MKEFFFLVVAMIPKFNGGMPSNLTLIDGPLNLAPSTE